MAIFRVPESESGVSRIHPSSEAANDFYVFASQRSGLFQVFKYDLQNDTTIQVTPGNNDSFVESVSEDGRYILIRTFASDLVGTLNNPPQLILRDSQDSSGQFTLVTESSGNEADSPCVNGSIISNGPTVAWQSRATNLDGSTGGNFQVFVRDMSSTSVNLASSNESGQTASNDCLNPHLESPDKVLFDTASSNFPGGDTHRKVYRKDLSSGDVELITDDDSERSFNAKSTGSGVVFQTENPELIGSNSNLNLPTQIARKSSSIDLVSKGSDDKPSQGKCSELSASGGDEISFTTRGRNLLNESSSSRQVVGIDMDQNERLPISFNPSLHKFGDDDSEFPAISPNGVNIIFESIATDLISSDTNNERDIFFNENWQDLDAPPVAKAGDYLYYEGDGSWIQIDGSDSYDPTGESLTFSWKVVFSPAGAVSEFKDDTKARTFFKADRPGIFELQLVVEDASGNTDNDILKINSDRRTSSLQATATASLQAGVIVPKEANSTLSANATTDIVSEVQ